MKPVLMNAYKNNIKNVRIIGRFSGKSKEGHWILRNCLVLDKNKLLGMEDHIWLNRIAARRIPMTIPFGVLIMFTAKLQPITRKDGSPSIRLEDPIIEGVMTRIAEGERTES